MEMALKDDRVEQCLRSCGSEFQMWGPKQETCFVIIRVFQSVWYMYHACVTLVWLTEH